jgi:hypothetical protein
VPGAGRASGGADRPVRLQQRPVRRRGDQPDDRALADGAGGDGRGAVAAGRGAAAADRAGDAPAAEGMERGPGHRDCPRRRGADRRAGAGAAGGDRGGLRGSTAELPAAGRPGQPAGPAPACPRRRAGGTGRRMPGAVSRPGRRPAGDPAGRSRLRAAGPRRAGGPPPVRPGRHRDAAAADRGPAAGQSARDAGRAGGPRPGPGADRPAQRERPGGQAGRRAAGLPDLHVGLDGAAQGRDGGTRCPVRALPGDDRRIRAGAAGASSAVQPVQLRCVAGADPACPGGRRRTGHAGPGTVVAAAAAGGAEARAGHGHEPAAGVLAGGGRDWSAEPRQLAEDAAAAGDRGRRPAAGPRCAAVAAAGPDRRPAAERLRPDRDYDHRDAGGRGPGAGNDRAAAAGPPGVHPGRPGPPGAGRSRRRAAHRAGACWRAAT